MPKREVPDKNTQRGQDGPEDVAIVDVCCRIQNASPGVGSLKALYDRLVLSAILSVVFRLRSNVTETYSWSMTESLSSFASL